MARKVKTESPATPATELDTSSLFSDPVESPATPPETPAEEKPKKATKKVTEIRPAEPSVVCGDDEANALLDLLQPICATAASKIYGIEKDICSRAFVFNGDQRRKINPPLIRVMNKWLPGLVKKYADEIGLGIVLFSTVNAQVRVAQMLDAQEKQRKAAAAQVPAPAPVTEIPVAGTAAD